MADSWPMIEACMRHQTVAEITRNELLTAGLISQGERYEGHSDSLAEVQVERDYVPLRSQVDEERIYQGGHHIDGSEPVIQSPTPEVDGYEG